MAVKLKMVQGKPPGAYLDFPDGEYTVGRGPECRIRYQSELISRRHCLLRVCGPSVHVRDLGSTNGTLINGWPIVGERVLNPGDALQVGPLVLEIVLDGVSGEPSASRSPRGAAPIAQEPPRDSEASRETVDDLPVMQFTFGDANFKAEYPSEEHAENAARLLASFILRRGPKQAIHKMQAIRKIGASEQASPAVDEPSGLDALHV